MKHLLIVLFAICLGSTIHAQNNHKYVKLKEVVKGKRYEIYLENTGSISYDVFLKIDTEDFRRSSKRPILQTIPGNSKKRVLTMVKLNEKKGNYTYLLVVNEVAYALEIGKTHDVIDFTLDKEIHNKNITLYTKNNCNLCLEATKILTKNNINFTEHNIDKDITEYTKLVKAIKEQSQRQPLSNSPIIKVNNKLHTNIKSLDDFIKTLRTEFN